jgi:outer membrane protein OmpA-like peptidoglycan-associated protein
MTPTPRLLASVGAALVAATLAFTPGCAPSPPTSPDAKLGNVDPPQNPDLGRYPARVSVDTLNLYVADGVRNACSGSAPFFEFDSAKVESEDKGSMNNLAQCMKIGPLQGKTIVLTGRTDPRGTEDYNEELGLQRAEKVKQYLIKRGIEGSRVKVRSLGKEDASPYPKDWATDRRVQIDLAAEQ